MYSDYSGFFAGGYFGGIILVMLLMMLFILIASIIVLVSKYKIFQKAGYAGWEAIIPFYGSWILVKITDLEWWFFLGINAVAFLGALSFGALAPFASIISAVALFFAHYNLSKKFEKEPIGFALGLTFLPFVFYPILAFDKKTVFNKDLEVSLYGPIEEAKIESIIPNKNKEEETKETSASKINKKNTFCKKCGNEVTGSEFCSKCGEKITK